MVSVLWVFNACLESQDMKPSVLFDYWFSLLAYIRSPYWIEPSQLFLIELSWLALTLIPIGRFTAYVSFSVKRYSLPQGTRVDTIHLLQTITRRGFISGRQSSLYAKACHFVRPLYRSDLSISCLADWPFTSGLSYRLLPPYMPDMTTWPLRTIVRVGLSPKSSIILLAAPHPQPLLIEWRVPAFPL